MLVLYGRPVTGKQRQNGYAPFDRSAHI